MPSSTGTMRRRTAALCLKSSAALIGLLLMAPLSHAEPLQLSLQASDLAHALPHDPGALHALGEVLDLHLRSEARGSHRSAAEVLTDLLDVDGVRVVADRRWNCPETLAVQHLFHTGTPWRPYISFGINRAIYRGAGVLSPALARAEGSHRSIGMLAQTGVAWELAPHLHLSADLHWLDLDARAAVLRTQGGYIPADPVGASLSVHWSAR